MTTARPWRRAKCRSCSAPVIWTITGDGRPLPVDAEPHPAGRMALYTDTDGTVRCRYANADERTLALPLFQPIAREPLYRSHWATCPNAVAHRRPRRSSL